MSLAPRPTHNRLLVSRLVVVVWLDLTLATVAYAVAWTFRFGPELPTFLVYARRAWLTMVIGQVMGVAVLGGYRRLSVATIQRSVIGAAVGGAAGYLVALVRFGPDGLSRSAIAGGTLLFVVLAVGWRVLALRIRTSWLP